MSNPAKPPPPKSSATFHRSNEKVTEQAPPEPPSTPSVAPASGRAVRPPPPPPSSKPSQPARIVQNARPLTEPGSKTTIHLDDSDLASLSSLASQTPFSIRRGLVLGGRFRVNQLIGAGAQCYVYSAEHTTLKSPVAIKCLQPQLVTPDLVERFAREAQALTAIRNPHVAAVLDVGRAPCGTPFIVMEFLQGRDLSALLETRPRLDPRQAAEILLQTCEGLAAAHALGLVHQDIKPSNIFLSDEMGIVKAKVVDFGVARVSVGNSPSIRPKFKPSVLDETVGGTPFYMPPEQFYANSIIDPRSDIFSLGMVLYEMLRGTPAFDLEMSTRQHGAPVRIEPTGIDPGLVAVIERCLQKRPEDRFNSVAELAVALLPFAPSRSRSHAEAAAAMLRTAGLYVTSTMPSSIPPPMSSQSLPVMVPPAPALPSMGGPGSKETVASAATHAKSRRTLVVGALLAVMIVAALGIGFKVWSSSHEKTAAASTPPAATTAASEPHSGSAIAIGAVVRNGSAESAAPAPSAAPSVTTAAAAPIASSARAPGAPGSAPRPLAGAGKKENAAAASAAGTEKSAAPAPAAQPASDELGF